MAVRYGAAWARMWDGVDVSLVKADWANELGPLEAHPGAIAYGLDHLPPDRPPTVAQFLALCIARPQQHVALPEPKADPAIAAAALGAIRRPEAEGPKAWAWTLRRRELSCERLTKAQRDAWREALKGDLAAREAA